MNRKKIKKKVVPKLLGSRQEKELNEIFDFTCDFAKLSYSEETRREESIIQQACSMQTSFSFVIAAAFMIMPIVIENRATMSLNLLLLVFSTIAAALLCSLFFATKAQDRKGMWMFPTAADLKAKIENKNDYNDLKKNHQRKAYLLDNYEIVYKSLLESNRQRVKWVVRSMNMFYCSLALCVFWFFICLIILF